MRTTMKLKSLCVYLQLAGLHVGAIAGEVDDVNSLPEFQRGWYAQDPTTKKFRVDLAKVDVEDVGGLKATVTATRREAEEAKAASAAAVKKALEPYAGLDPVRAKAIMDQFASEEERRLIATGPEGMKKVVEARMEKEREEMHRQLEEAAGGRDGALEVASVFMEKVLDGAVSSVAAAAGVYPSAIEDVLLRARSIFSVDDTGAPVQFGEDGETVIMGKDGKTPYSPKEWMEEMKVKCPHWFPNGNGGGGAHGNRGKGSGADLSGLSPVERMTRARAETSR